MPYAEHVQRREKEGMEVVRNEKFQVYTLLVVRRDTKCVWSMCTKSV